MKEKKHKRKTKPLDQHGIQVEFVDEIIAKNISFVLKMNKAHLIVALLQAPGIQILKNFTPEHLIEYN